MDRNKIQTLDHLIARGPRPDSAEDMDYLVQRGIKRILNLQGLIVEFLQVEEEKSWAAQRGVEFVHQAWSLITPPSIKEINAALHYMAPVVAPLGTTYVHCHDGVDRTGIACLAYRCVKQGWTFGKAVGEMIDDGTHLHWYSWWLPTVQDDLIQNQII
jgi:protein tyrosine phosphatase